MKKLKENKGITLIALIITIIVLLILAVVAISAVQGDGIIAHAKNARDNYQTAQSEENSTLAGYQAELDNANNETVVKENSKEGEVPYSFTINELIEDNVITIIGNKCLAGKEEDFVKYIGFKSLTEFKTSKFYVSGER